MDKYNLKKRISYKFSPDVVRKYLFNGLSLKLNHLLKRKENMFH